MASSHSVFQFAQPVDKTNVFRTFLTRLLLVAVAVVTPNCLCRQHAVVALGPGCLLLLCSKSNVLYQLATLDHFSTQVTGVMYKPKIMDASSRCWDRVFGVDFAMAMLLPQGNRSPKNNDMAPVAWPCPFPIS